LSMQHWYYAPWQYELREFVVEETRDPTEGKTRIIPRQYRAPLLVGLAFLAYTPLVQPGPPAKRPTPGTLQIYQLGGGMIV
jgi:hypothetical protein